MLLSKKVSRNRKVTVFFAPGIMNSWQNAYDRRHMFTFSPPAGVGPRQSSLSHHKIYLSDRTRANTQTYTYTQREKTKKKTISMAEIHMIRQQFLLLVYYAAYIGAYDSFALPTRILRAAVQIDLRNRMQFYPFLIPACK